MLYEAATQTVNLSSPEKQKSVKGALHIIHRIFPILFEEKDTMFRIMWRDDSNFPGQINALHLMESISLLLFKPGFTIKEVSQNAELNYYSKFQISFVTIDT